MSAGRRTALALLLLAWPVHAQAQERMAGYLQEEYSCIMCHTDKRAAFLEGVHAERGIVCVDCHGGNPKAFERERAHADGYRGKFSKVRTVALCLDCHGDVGRMRQYGISAVTREEFLLSRHGQRLLLAGDTAAPSCSDCHGSHAIFPRQDGRSTVNPARVTETCARCHADPARMPRALPADQLERWRRSAHGVALVERHNSQAATCASCHGSHAAAPPGVSEVANVCGTCHRLVENAYLRGAHGRRAAAVTCIACHSNHDTEAPAGGEIRARCATCHAQGSPAALAGLQLQERLGAAVRAEEQAREAIAHLVRNGEVTRDEEVRLLTVQTDLETLRVVAHTLDAEAIDELVRRVESISREIREQAEIVGEERWERKLLVIPLWLGVLAGIALAARKRRVLARRSRGSPEGGSAAAGEGQGAP